MRDSYSRASTGRGGDRSTPSAHNTDSSVGGGSHPASRPSSSRMRPPRATVDTLDHLRVPPSVVESDRPMNAILGNMRFSYEIAYREPSRPFFYPLRVEQPSRRLPLADVTTVPRGYIQDLLELISALSSAFSHHLTMSESRQMRDPGPSRRRHRR